MTLRFTVYGDPQPAGSKRAFVRPGMRFASVVDANPNSRAWKTEVSREAARVMEGRPLLDGPLAVEFRFYRPRPKGHFGIGRNAGVLRAGAETHPTSRPDVLKLARAVEDALTGVVYRDDSQIVDERLVKAWGEPARVEIVLASLVDGPEIGLDGVQEARTEQG